MDVYQLVHKTETKVLLAETYSPLDIVMKYYGNGVKKGAHIPFNFLMISQISNNSNAEDYANTINAWLNLMVDDRTANWVIGNHDKNRVGSRLGADRMDMLNMIVMTLPGIAVTYQGEEIGMTDVWISWNDTKDPSACNSNEQIYETLSRDPERTPFQWNDGPNAGFSRNSSTWLPVGPLYKTVNVKRERGIAKSHLNIYKQLRGLRNEDAFKKNNTARVKALNKNVLAILRTDNKKNYITLININNEIENVNLAMAFKDLPSSLQYVLLTDHSSHKFGDKISTNNIVLLPKESVILSSFEPAELLNNNYFKYVVT